MVYILYKKKNTFLYIINITIYHFLLEKKVIKIVKQMCAFDYAQLPQFSPNLQIQAVFILLLTHLVSGTAANEPVTHTHLLSLTMNS